VKIVCLDGEVDLEGFRQAARAAAASGLNESAVGFVTTGDEEESDLFAEHEAVTAQSTAGQAIRVPPRFLAMADLVCRHREPSRYDLLYAALLRLRDTPRLLEIASDPLVRRLEDMERAVRRDRRKMTAFVRFREIEAPDGAHFVAWFEPTHYIEELTAPFFVDRFASMRFATDATGVDPLGWSLALRSGRAARGRAAARRFRGRLGHLLPLRLQPGEVDEAGHAEGDAEEILGQFAGNASDPGHVFDGSALRGADRCDAAVQDRPRLRKSRSPLRQSPKTDRAGSCT